MCEKKCDQCLEMTAKIENVVFVDNKKCVLIPNPQSDKTLYLIKDETSIDRIVYPVGKSLIDSAIIGVRSFDHVKPHDKDAMYVKISTRGVQLVGKEHCDDDAVYYRCHQQTVHFNIMDGTSGIFDQLKCCMLAYLHFQTSNILINNTGSDFGIVANTIDHTLIYRVDLCVGGVQINPRHVLDQVAEPVIEPEAVAVPGFPELKLPTLPTLPTLPALPRLPRLPELKLGNDNTKNIGEAQAMMNTVGGFVGRAINGSCIDQCLMQGTGSNSEFNISSTINTGGFVGLVEKSTVKCCKLLLSEYSNVTIYGLYAGGFNAKNPVGWKSPLCVMKSKAN